MAVTQTQKVVFYPDSDGKPMAETPYHLEAMLYLIAALQAHFAPRQDVYVAGTQFLYWIEGNPKQRVAPDVYVAFGVPKTPLLPTWKVWEVGKAPDVVIEVSSRSTASEDLGRKYALYGRLGVKEYFLIDVTREYLVAPVVLYRLEGKEYVQVLPEVVGEEWRVCSEQLGLEVVVRWDGERYRVRLYDPVSGRYLPTLEEEVRARARVEARLRELEEELRRLKGNGNPSSL
ncbi:MAG: Uma2 family endonuclease [Armatimonadota bacterium]